MSFVDFEIHVPVADDGLAANVRHSLALRLPEVRAAIPRPETLTIIANGPSAMNAPQDGPTLAVNGSLGLFRDPPTFWAGCDPQAHLADFLRDAPKATTYLVASKCHPSVFEALKHHNVLVWHVAETGTIDQLQDRLLIPSGVSITICSFTLMWLLGFRKFRTWGWDGCYIDGRDHAVPQPILPIDIENEVAGETFQTTTSWALEAQDAWHKLAGWPIEINGGGMIGAIFNLMRD